MNKKIISFCLMLILALNCNVIAFANTEEAVPYYVGCLNGKSTLSQVGNSVKVDTKIEMKKADSYDSVKIYARLQQVSTGDYVKTWNTSMKKNGKSFSWSGTYATYSNTVYRLKVSCSGYKDGKLIETITLSDVTLKTT